MSKDTDTKDWLRVHLQPAESVTACISAILWVAIIGVVIASARMVSLVSAAFNVEPPAITSFVEAIGNATARYWLVSFPLWGAAVVGSFLWALSIPERRQNRLVVLAFALVIALFVVLIATYVPFAQSAASIAMPHPASTVAP